MEFMVLTPLNAPVNNPGFLAKHPTIANKLCHFSPRELDAVNEAKSTLDPVIRNGTFEELICLNQFITLLLHL